MEYLNIDSMLDGMQESIDFAMETEIADKIIELMNMLKEVLPKYGIYLF